MVRGPGQPVRTPAGAGVQGCLFTWVQGGGVAFAALTRNSVNCPFTRSLSRGIRAFLFSHSVLRGVQGALICSLLTQGDNRYGVHPGLSLRNRAVLSRGPVRTATTTSNGAPAPSAPPSPLSDPTELCRLEDESILVARSLRRAKRRSRDARALTAACRCSVVRSQHSLQGLSITLQVLQSAHRGSVAAMIWLHFPLFWLSRHYQ